MARSAYPEAFRAAAVERAREDGRPLAAIALDLQINVQSLAAWVNAAGGRRTGQTTLRGSPLGPRTRRFPCRYGCGGRTTREGAACGAPACQRRRRREYEVAHPERAEASRIGRRELIWDQRREAGSPERNPPSPRGQSRRAVHICFTEAENAALRAYADRHGLTLSRAVVSALAQAGVFEPPVDDPEAD